MLVCQCITKWVGCRVHPRRCNLGGRLAQLRLTALASRSCCSCEQWAKVPPRISLISVCEMSTDRNLLQCSHAAGPIQLKSAGRNNDSTIFCLREAEKNLLPGLSSLWSPFVGSRVGFGAGHKRQMHEPSKFLTRRALMSH